MPALVAVAFEANQILQVETMVREKLKMSIMMRKSYTSLAIVNTVLLIHLLLQQNLDYLKCKSFSKHWILTFTLNSVKHNRSSDNRTLAYPFMYLHQQKNYSICNIRDQGGEDDMHTLQWVIGCVGCILVRRGVGPDEKINTNALQ